MQAPSKRTIELVRDRVGPLIMSISDPGLGYPESFDDVILEDYADTALHEVLSTLEYFVEAIEVVQVRRALRRDHPELEESALTAHSSLSPSSRKMLRQIDARWRTLRT